MRHERRYVGDSNPSFRNPPIPGIQKLTPLPSVQVEEQVDLGKSPQEIWEEAFVAGSEYGYNYHRLTLFPENDWSAACRNSSKQKAIKLNPYHSLNELED